MWRRALRLTPPLLWNHATHGHALDILVTHSPPAGIHDGPDRAHQGFAAFLWLMRTFKPALLAARPQTRLIVTRRELTSDDSIYDTDCDQRLSHGGSSNCMSDHRQPCTANTISRSVRSASFVKETVTVCRQPLVSRLAILNCIEELALALGPAARPGRLCGGNGRLHGHDGGGSARRG